MFTSLWTLLPGNRLFRSFVILAIVAGIAFGLVALVFPWIEGFLSDPTIN